MRILLTQSDSLPPHLFAFVNYPDIHSAASTKMWKPANEGARALIEAAAVEERLAMQATLWRPWL